MRPLYKVKVQNSDDSGIQAVSFVSSPAMEADFISLSSVNPIEVKLQANVKKQVLTGAVIIPEKRIPRLDSSGEEYDIVFDELSIWEINKKLHKNKLTSNTNIEHFIPVDGNYLVESWIVEDPTNDKANALGLGSYPKGTLIMSIHIPDSNLFEEVSNKMKGFSLEGIFHHVQINPTNNNLKMNKEFLSKLKEDFLSIFSKYDTEKVNEKVEVEKLSTEAPAPLAESKVEDQSKVVEPVPVEKSEVDKTIEELKSAMEAVKKQLADMTTSNETLSKEKAELEVKVTELSKQPATTKVDALPVTPVKLSRAQLALQTVIETSKLRTAEQN